MFVRVEALITDHLIDFVPDLEKYKVVKAFSMLKGRNQDCKSFGNYIL